MLPYSNEIFHMAHSKPELSTGDSSQLERALSARAYLFTLFHKAFGAKPTAELVEALCAPATIEALSVWAAVSEPCAALRLYCRTLSFSTIQGGFLIRANAEYTRLFDNAAARCGASGGPAPRNSCGTCASLMCAICATWAQDALDALRGGSAEDLRASLSAQLAFNRGHLTPWLPQFADRLARSSSSVLYPQMASCLADLMRLDESFCEHALETVGGSEICPVWR